MMPSITSKAHSCQNPTYPNVAKNSHEDFAVVVEMNQAQIIGNEDA